MDSTWIKASKSANGGECVEMQSAGHAVRVRDSKAQGHGPVLTLAPVAFGAWLKLAKSGRLDKLI